MKTLMSFLVLLICTACAPVPVQDLEEREYQRVDYYQSVFEPMAHACLNAGGFMVFEDQEWRTPRQSDLSYADMRLAVMRGCSGR